MRQHRVGRQHWFMAHLRRPD